MKNKFAKYTIIATLMTCSCIYISKNYNTKIVHKLWKTSVNAAVTTNENTNKYNYTLVSEGAFFTPVLNNNGDKILYSSGDDIYEYDLLKKDTKQLTTMGNCYNPVYDKRDNNIIAFARNDGIYKMDISKNLIHKVAGSKNPQISYAKPNFTPEGDIIYFRVLVVPRDGDHGFTEKDPSIYKLSSDGKREVKILSGYNPLLSHDGKKLIYEWKDSIYLMDLESKKTKLIDAGKYASLSNDDKTISYAKYDRETVAYNKIGGQNKLYVDKEFSNIYIADLSNVKNKLKLTAEEFDNKDTEIESWAKDTMDSSTEQHFLLVSKMSYFDTAWSKSDDAIFISVYNTDKGDFELIKINIDKR